MVKQRVQIESQSSEDPGAQARASLLIAPDACSTAVHPSVYKLGKRQTGWRKHTGNLLIASMIAIALGVLYQMRIHVLPKVAFYYGSDIPVSALTQYQWTIVEAEALGDPKDLQAQGTEVFAYVSLGEAETWRPESKRLQSNWLLGENPAWGSYIADVTQHGWQDFVINERIVPLWQQGYRGFFLDTLDSYKKLINGKPEMQSQTKAMIDFIRRIHARFPQAKILINRGFDLLPHLGSWLTGVVAESLFQSWDAEASKYRAVTDDERSWLREQLNKIRDRYGYPIIVIDYVEEGQTALAQATAKRIAADGFIPWVAPFKLDRMGVGLEAIESGASR